MFTSRIRTQMDRRTPGGRNLLMEQLEDRTLLTATLLTDGAISNWTMESKAESGPASAQNTDDALQISTEAGQAPALVASLDAGGNGGGGQEPQANYSTAPAPPEVVPAPKTGTVIAGSADRALDVRWLDPPADDPEIFNGTVNAPPETADDIYVVHENSELSVISVGGVLANDHDIDGEELAAVLVSGPSHGSLTLLDNGGFTYTPDPDFNREDSFQYVASDGASDSNVATVTIIVETSYPWHNGIEPLNVNDDGYYKGQEFVNFITPLDALVVINELNSNGRHKLSVDRTRPLAQPFFDVNRDGFVTPLDVLWLINYLIEKHRVSEVMSSESTEGMRVTVTQLETLSNRDDHALEVGPVLVAAAEPVGMLLSPNSGLPSAKVATELLFAENDDTEWVAEDLDATFTVLAKGQLGL